MTKSEAEPTVDIEILKADLAKVKGDLASLAGSLVDRGRESTRALRRTIEDKVAETVDATEEFVQEHPMTSIILAFGAGLLATILLCRR